MSKTTEQWAALLQGTTDGPWRIDTSDPDWPQLVGPVVLEGNLITMKILVDELGQLEDPNLHLAAAAPEAVAEVIRLRRELEALKRKTGNLTLSSELLAGDHPMLSGALRGAANEFRELHDIITRILEGNNE